MRAKVRLSPMNTIGGCYYEPKHFPTLLTVLTARKRKQAPSVPEKKRPSGRFLLHGRFSEAALVFAKFTVAESQSASMPLQRRWRR